MQRKTQNQRKWWQWKHLRLYVNVFFFSKQSRNWFSFNATRPDSYKVRQSIKETNKLLSVKTATGQALQAAQLTSHNSCGSYQGQKTNTNKNIFCKQQQQQTPQAANKLLWLQAARKRAVLNKSLINFDSLTAAIKRKKETWQQKK